MFFFRKKYFVPITTSIRENTRIVNEISDRVTSHSTQAAQQFEQIIKSQKELSMQMEEIYDRMSETGAGDGCDTDSLVAAAISMREEIGRLYDYSIARCDKDLAHHVKLLVAICDRKLFGAGVFKIERLGEPYDSAMDLITDVECAPDVLPNVNVKVLSGCYKYYGKIAKRANVIVNKSGEA